MKGLRIALSFMTVLPVRSVASFQPGDLGRSASWFPLAGLLIGLLLAAAWWLLGLAFPDPLRAVLVVALWALLTGGLHLDGLADCCDALLAPVSVERRLEILKDPRLGSFGGTGLILALLLKVSALMALPQGAGWLGLLPLVFAPALARWLILLLARQPMARPGGLGAEFALGVTGRTYLFAALVPLGLVLAGLAFGAGWQVLLALALAHLVALGVIALARARLGGLTGDVLGLVVELGELAALLAFAV
jgi:adenosylcobinamide-GDP ribazoletransferase